LRNKLKSITFNRVYSSDRKRATQTARIIFNGARITKLKGLREMSFGVFEGLSYKEIMKRYPKIYQEWLVDPFKNSIPEAEGLNSFKMRVGSAIKKIVSLNPGKTIAVVSHGGAISIFITTILKSKDFWRYIPRPASITIVEYKKDKPKIKLFNQTAHLR
jgi:broad specificity phosphatase PhoE